MWLYKKIHILKINSVKCFIVHLLIIYKQCCKNILIDMIQLLYTGENKLWQKTCENLEYNKVDTYYKHLSCTLVECRQKILESYLDISMKQHVCNTYA